MSCLLGRRPLLSVNNLVQNTSTTNPDVPARHLLEIRYPTLLGKAPSEHLR